MRHTTTHHLDDRRIEVSAERHGDVVRLRSWLVKDDFIDAAHTNDYDLSSTTIGAAIADFTAEIEAVAGVALPRPLLPDDLFQLKCPAAPQASAPCRHLGDRGRYSRGAAGCPGAVRAVH
jgi:hypothetical protein